MRAAVVERPGGTPRITDISITDVGTGEVRIRIAACGVCHTDLTWSSGRLGEGYGFPVVLGHEAAGVVEEIGAGVRDIAVGDHAVIALAHHCGHCFYCESGTPMLCANRRERIRLHRDGQALVQGFGVGGFAESVVVGSESVVPMPSSLPLPVAALLGCAVATGLGAVSNIAGVETGSRVLVLGAGAIGISIVMGSVLAGAAEISVIDPRTARRQAAMTAGATGTHAALADEAGADFDFVFEATGRTEVMEAAIAATRPGGTVTLLGVPAADAVVRVPALDFVASQRRLLGCITGNVRPNVDLPRYARLYESGRLPLDLLVGERVPLDALGDAFEAAERGDHLRIVVEP